MVTLPAGKLNILIDGQFGSTGKGLLASYIGSKHKIDLAISNAAPNAGHSFDMNDGLGVRVAYHLPVSGILNPDCQIYICAGAIIDPEILNREIEQFGCQRRVKIHPRAAIVTKEHGAREKDPAAGTAKLASTQKGVGQALADKISRAHDVKLARDVFDSDLIDIINVDEYLKNGKTALMEVPQGFGLSLNHGYSYPHCTSRDITIASAMNDAHVHPFDLGQVIVSMRTHPIRVGHIYDDHNNITGHSGPFWPDSTEIDFTDLGIEPEYTTVTKRRRRIATFSFSQYEEILNKIRPDVVFFNFINHFKNAKDTFDFFDKIDNSERLLTVAPKRLYGLGPKVCDVYDNLDDAIARFEDRGEHK